VKFFFKVKGGISKSVVLLNQKWGKKTEKKTFWFFPPPRGPPPPRVGGKK